MSAQITALLPSPPSSHTLAPLPVDLLVKHGAASSGVLDTIRNASRGSGEAPTGAEEVDGGGQERRADRSTTSHGNTSTSHADSTKRKGSGGAAHQSRKAANDEETIRALAGVITQYAQDTAEAGMGAAEGERTAERAGEAAVGGGAEELEAPPATSPPKRDETEVLQAVAMLRVMVW